MKTSVIISTVNRKQAALRLFESLVAQSTPPDEILLIEAGYAPWDKSELPPSLQPGFRVIDAPGMSLAAARDLGRKEAAGNVLFFFDDDILPPKNYIESALHYLAHHSTIMAVGGAYTDRAVQDRRGSSILIGRLLGIYADGRRNRLLPSGWADYVRGPYAREITHADWLFGCNFAVRASAFTKAGFESRMAAWSFLEDVFFGVSLKEAFGDCMRVLPALKVIHDPPASGGAINVMSLRMRMLYRYLLWREHISRSGRLHLLPFSLGMVANLLLMIKQERKFWVVTETAKSLRFILQHRNVDWDGANGFILSKD
ncbi:MAG: glycosyltransferase family 2 protein [Pseudomonadota bacterium]|nr:glycosyltransferase family 2 protein [Pseudomonadota bacterium]